MRFSIGLVLLVSSLAFAADSRLSEAAMRGDRAAVATLLKQGVDIDGAQGDGSTALHWAAFNDDLETTKMLIAAGANVKVTTREGAITPLFMAATNGNAAIIEALIKAGAGANSVKATGTTALMLAAGVGRGTGVFAKDYATEAELLAAVKLLVDLGVESGVDINAANDADQTALHIAAGRPTDVRERVP